MVHWEIPLFEMMDYLMDVPRRICTHVHLFCLPSPKLFIQMSSTCMKSNHLSGIQKPITYVIRRLGDSRNPRISCHEVANNNFHIFLCIIINMYIHKNGLSNFLQETSKTPVKHSGRHFLN